MRSRAPKVVVIAGPNGAGKTTIAEDIVGRVFGIPEFVMEIREILRGRYMNIEPRGSTPPHVAEPRIADPLTAQIVAAANRVVLAAIREHDLLGFPIVAWDREHGCVKIIPPPIPMIAEGTRR